MPPFDMNSMMQQYAIMGAAFGGGGGGGPDAFLRGAAAQQQQQPNLGRYAAGREVRQAIWGGIRNQQQQIRGAGRYGAGGGAYIPSSPYDPMQGGMDPSSLVSSDPANKLLSQYGLQLPTHINPFLLFNDQNRDGSPTWAGNHPRVAKAIEGAMVGASVGPSSTPGEAISNISRTIMGMPNLYHERAASQMLAPFAMAQQLQSLQAGQTEQDLRKAQISNLQSEVDARGREKFQPFYVPGSGVVGFDPAKNTMTPTTSTIPISPDVRPEKIGGPVKPGAALNYPRGVSTSGERAAYNELRQMGYDNPLGEKTWNSRVVYWTGRLAGATGAGSTSGRKSVEQNVYGSMTDAEKKITDSKKKAWDDAEADLKGAVRLKPSDVPPGSYPGDTYPQRKAAAKQALKAQRDQAQQEYNDYIDNVQKASTRPGRIITGTRDMNQIPSNDSNDPAGLFPKKK